MSCSSPTLGLVSSPHPSEAGRRRLCPAVLEPGGQAGLKRLLFLLSLSVFPLAAHSLPQVLGMQLPAAPPVLHIQLCSFPALGLLPQAPLGHLGLSPSHCLQGTALVLPRLWERRSSVLPSWGGKVCSCFCLFPVFIPRLSSPLAAAMECPWSSHRSAQTWLLPVPRQAAPASQPSTAAPSLEKPGIKHGVLVSCLWSCLA